MACRSLGIPSADVADSAITRVVRYCTGRRFARDLRGVAEPFISADGADYITALIRFPLRAPVFMEKVYNSLNA